VVLTGADDGLAAAEMLHTWGVGWAAVTLGPRGCALVTDDAVLQSPGYDVPVVDTTGCGDAFSAALVIAKLQGRAPADAAAFANAAAALVATGLGSDAGLIDAAHVDELIAESSASGSVAVKGSA